MPRNSRLALLSLLSLLILAGYLAFIPEKGPILHAETNSNVESTRGDTLALLAIMVRLEADMNQISAGIWRENYEMIKRGARNIASHPKIPRRQVKTIRSILGAREFQTFVRDD